MNAKEAAAITQKAFSGELESLIEAIKYEARNGNYHAEFRTDGKFLGFLRDWLIDNGYECGELYDNKISTKMSIMASWDVDF